MICHIEKLMLDNKKIMIKENLFELTEEQIEMSNFNKRGI